VALYRLALVEAQLQRLNYSVYKNEVGMLQLSS